MNPKTLFRAALSVAGISKPIKLWWTEEQIRQWQKKEIEHLAVDYARIKTTPYSMVEFLAGDFLGIEFTDERSDADSVIVRESTLLYNHYHSNRIPIPLGSMNDHFTYPSVLLGFNRTFDHDVTYFDYTGYFNFQFLKEDRKDIEQFLEDPRLFATSRFEMDDFTIAEYSVPPKS